MLQQGRRAAAVLLCACLGLAAAKRGSLIPNYAGPYIVYLSRFSMCEGLHDGPEKYIVSFKHYNPSRPFEQQAIHGNLTLVEPMTDQRWSSTIVDIRANNQWKENYLVFNTSGARGYVGLRSGICSSIRTHLPALFEHVFKKDPVALEPCFVRPGIYMFNFSEVRWERYKSSTPVPVFPYGHYRSRHRSGHGERLLSCLSFETHVVPRPF